MEDLPAAISDEILSPASRNFIGPLILGRLKLSLVFACNMVYEGVPLEDTLREPYSTSIAASSGSSNTRLISNTLTRPRTTQLKIWNLLPFPLEAYLSLAAFSKSLDTIYWINIPYETAVQLKSSCPTAPIFFYKIMLFLSTVQKHFGYFPHNCFSAITDYSKLQLLIVSWFETGISFPGWSVTIIIEPK